MRSIILAAVLTVLVVSTALAAHQIASFVMVDGDTTATYTVTSDGSPAISHVTIPGCAEIEPTITGCPGLVTYGADPTTGVAGYKCDAGGSYTLTFTWPGELTTETAQAAIKAGPGFELVPVDAVTCVPQAVVVEDFQYRDGAFTWWTTMEVHVAGYRVVDSTDTPVTPWVAANAGSTLAATYSAIADVPFGVYTLIVYGIAGDSERAATYNHVPPTAVTVASFTAATRPFCYRSRSVCLCTSAWSDKPYRVPMLVCTLAERKR